MIKPYPSSATAYRIRAERWRWTAAMLLLGLVVACAPGRARPVANGVILVVVDTLRADHLTVYGYPRSTSPELDRWSERAAVFEHALAPSPWTLPSFGSILTGRYPSAHGAGTERLRPQGGKPNFSGLDPAVPTLPATLDHAGFATAAMVTNTFLRPQFGLDRGFGSYDYARNHSISVRRADVMVDRALAWIDGHRAGPFFLMLQLLDPHLPYDPPSEVQGAFTGDYSGELELPFAPRFGRVAQIRRGEWRLDADDRAFVAAAYDEEILFVDQQLGRFLDALEARHLLDDSLFVLTADHGEELFDHGSFEHGHTAYQELLHVPLMVWGPGVRPGRIDEPVSLVDITATVLEVLGLDVPEGVDGKSLRPMLDGSADLGERVLLAESMLFGHERQAMVAWPRKAIRELAGGRSQLFDLSADPGETQDLAPAQPRLLTRMLDRLEEEFAALVTRRSGGQALELDEDTREELRSLGYLE